MRINKTEKLQRGRNENEGDGENYEQEEMRVKKSEKITKRKKLI